MHDCKSIAHMRCGKSFRPAQPFFTDSRAQRCNQISQPSKQRDQLGMRSAHFCEPLLGPKHPVGVPKNTGPSERAYLINDFRWTRPTEYQITAVQNQVRGNSLEVRENRVQCPPVPMNIGDSRNSHETHSAPVSAH